MLRNKCAICDSILKNIYKLDNIPIKITCLENQTSFNFETLSISKCNDCNTFQLDKLIPLDLLYSESHNYSSVGKIWENYFKLFTEKISLLIQNKNILEIGDPSGKIALQVNNYNKWVIVEPNKNPKIIFNVKHFYYRTKFKNIKIGVFIKGFNKFEWIGFFVFI
jgi:hypothetical protein